MHCRYAYTAGTRRRLGHARCRDVVPAQVEAHFKQFGSCTFALITNAEGASRGFGFLEFADAHSLKEALLQRKHTIGTSTVRGMCALHTVQPPVLSGICELTMVILLGVLTRGPTTQVEIKPAVR